MVHINSSPLLRLPGELRNQIWTYAVIRDDHVDLLSDRVPPLAQTCRSIRAECIRMHYASNIFAFFPRMRDDNALKLFERWLSRIGPDHCNALRCMVITLTKDTSLLVNNREGVSDPWASLIRRVAGSGCAPQLRIHIDLHSDIRPVRKVYVEGLRALRAGWRVKNCRSRQRRYMHWALTVYLEMLRRKHYWPDRFNRWESQFAEDDGQDFVESVRAAAYHSDLTGYWTGRPESGRGVKSVSSQMLDRIAWCLETFADMPGFEVQVSREGILYYGG